MLMHNIRLETDLWTRSMALGPCLLSLSVRAPSNTIEVPMSSANIDNVFAGSVPKLYETYLVPLIFEPYALDLGNRVATMNVSRILEVAAGTGVVTRALAAATSDRTSIIATDLNQAMLDHAAAVGTSHRVKWQQAD